MIGGGGSGSVANCGSVSVKTLSFSGSPRCQGAPLRRSRRCSGLFPRERFKLRSVSHQRQQSLVRLVAAGVQTDIEAMRSAAESLAREERLDEARVEQWKAWQRLRRLR